MREKLRSIRNKEIVLRVNYRDIIWLLFIAAIFVVTLELFYRMIVNYNNRYESDVIYYVATMFENGEEPTRLLSNMFFFFHSINEGTLEANIYLAATMSALVVANYFAIRYFIRKDGLGDKVPRHAMQLFSAIMIFAGPLYVPVVHEWYYRKSFSSFAWHSPTQQSMTLWALIAAICFIEMYTTGEKEGVDPWKWLLTMVTTLIATGFKPSYTISLCAAILVMFSVDLIRGGKEGFAQRLIRLIIMGTSVIPSGLYIIWLNNKEFTEGTQLGEEHKIIIGFSTVLNYEHLWAAILFGITIALLVFAFNLSRFRDRKYRVVLYIFIMGVMQWALISETGTRGNYGNFTWGRIFGSYFLTLAACSILLENYYDKSYMSDNQKLRKIYLTAACIVVVWSVITQLIYLYMILKGHGYMH